jgi:hypothetical protein
MKYWIFIINTFQILPRRVSACGFYPQGVEIALKVISWVACKALTTP